LQITTRERNAVAIYLQLEDLTVTIYNIFDYFNTQTRFIGWGVNPPVFVGKWLGNQLVLHWVNERLELKELEGRATKGDGQTCSGDDCR
jgi:hypothetical protein